MHHNDFYLFEMATTSRTTWFETLFGFSESLLSVRNNLLVNYAHHITLESKSNGRVFDCGSFSTPKLKYLRTLVANMNQYEHFKGKAMNRKSAWNKSVMTKLFFLNRKDCLSSLSYWRRLSNACHSSWRNLSSC